MYHFRIIKLEDEGYRFELGGIKMLIPGYRIEGDRHCILNPDKSFAYFSFENNIYGISNEAGHAVSAEEFYDTICEQYMIFADKATPATDVAPVSSLVNNNSADNSLNFKRTA